MACSPSFRSRKGAVLPLAGVLDHFRSDVSLSVVQGERSRIQEATDSGRIASRARADLDHRLGTAPALEREPMGLSRRDRIVIAAGALIVFGWMAWDWFAT